MSSVRVEVAEDEPQDIPIDEDPEPRTKRRRGTHVDVEIEREVTKRRMIESVSQIVVVILYMAFTLLRDRDSGVVILDEDEGPEDDWAE
jgi:hypothetical protein